MAYYLLKLLITAALVVIVSEVARRAPLLAGLLASLPLVSFLALIWLYLDTQSTEQVARLSTSIFWLVLPSLSLFLILPWLLRQGVGFALSLSVATAAMFVLYLAQIWSLGRLGVRI